VGTIVSAEHNAFIFRADILSRRRYPVPPTHQQSLTRLLVAVTHKTLKLKSSGSVNLKKFLGVKKGPPKRCILQHTRSGTPNGLTLSDKNLLTQYETPRKQTVSPDDLATSFCKHGPWLRVTPFDDMMVMVIMS
jgi:hypothetical protein